MVKIKNMERLNNGSDRMGRIWCFVVGSVKYLGIRGKIRFYSF